MDDFLKNYGERIIKPLRAAVLKEGGFDTVAKRMNIHPMSLRNRLNPKHYHRIDKIIELCNALNIYLVLIDFNDPKVQDSWISTLASSGIHEVGLCPMPEMPEYKKIMNEEQKKHVESCSGINNEMLSSDNPTITSAINLYKDGKEVPCYCNCGARAEHFIMGAINTYWCKTCYIKAKDEQTT